MAMGATHAVSVPERLVVPRYGYAEADRLAHVRAGTSKRWTRGYSYQSAAGERVRKPPVGKTDSSVGAAVSFADLIEVAAIRGLLALDLTLPQIRKVVMNCRKRFESERPLLTHRFRVGGGDVFVEGSQELVDVLHGPRTAWSEVLDPFLATIDYQDGWAQRWWPAGRSSQVVLDPQFGYGLPVVDGTGVRTEILVERGDAGDSIDQIAADFGVSTESVRDALKYERSLTA